MANPATTSNSPAFTLRTGFLPVPVNSQMYAFRETQLFPQLRAKLMQLRMMHERGFDLGDERQLFVRKEDDTGQPLTTADLDRVSYDKLLRFYNADKLMTNADEQLNSVYVRDQYRVVVIYISAPDGKVSKDQITQAIGKMFPKSYTQDMSSRELMLILRSRPTASQLTNYDILSVPRKTLWLWENLQYHPLTMCMQPRIRIFTTEEREQFFQQNPQIEGMLPTLSTEDAVSRWLGLFAGQLVAFRRFGGTEDGIEYVRQVVAAASET